MSMVRGQYAQLMAKGLRKIFVQWNETYQRDLEYPAVFNVEIMTSAYEDELEFAGMGPTPIKWENAPVFYQNLIQGGTIRAIPLTYALAGRTSFELYDDDQYGIIKQVPKAIARSNRFTEEMVPWNIINLGFSTIKSIDGVTLFNNQHPLLGGTAATNYGPGLTNIISASGTYPNRPATDIDLSFAGVQLMTNQFERMVDGVGLPVVYKPKAILIAPANRFLARELLGSPGKPGTATNEINSLLGEDLGYIVGHYLTSDSAWFALCDKQYHHLKFKWRMKPVMDLDDDFDTGALKEKSTMRFTAVPANWLGVWGSNGP
jgi:hypothetical protein